MEPVVRIGSELQGHTVVSITRGGVTLSNKTVLSLQEVETLAFGE